jgi:hypothetical protein
MWRLLSTLLSKPKTASHVQASRGLPEPIVEVQLSATATPLDLLWLKVSHLSRTDYRFVDPTYSPMSRVPCADFTPFIIDRLRSNDVSSIQQLMRAVIAANPGLGCGPDWIDESVDEVSRIDFGPYCHSSSENFLLELKALFILGAKEGSGRGFWLADEKPLLFALALCCHDIRWLEGLEQLRGKANRFIRRMRQDTPFWQDYPLFDASAIGYPSAPVTGVASTLTGLSVLSRVHLLRFAEWESGALMHATTSKMRSLGLNPLESAPRLLTSGICEFATDSETVAGAFSKNELISALDERAVSYRKSWGKTQLLEALRSSAPDFVAQVADREKVARVKPGSLPDLRLLRAYANEIHENMKLLCFAGSAT